jgi:hypothetical protein
MVIHGREHYNGGTAPALAPAARSPYGALAGGTRRFVICSNA